MPSMLTTFSGDVLTKTAALSQDTQDAHVTTLVTPVAHVESIATPSFLAARTPNFYASPLYTQWILQKNPPSNTSYGKDPGDTTDDSNDPNLNFNNFVNLPSGAEQIKLTGDQSFLYQSDFSLTVEGTRQTGYDGSTTQTINGKTNRKVYNGALTILNGTTTQFFNALVTTYEHQNVTVQSFHSDTILHFGDRTIQRKGNEVNDIVGGSSDTTFGDSKDSVYGKALEITEGKTISTSDVTFDLSFVAGLRMEINLALALTTYLAVFVAFNAVSGVIAVKEQLAGLLKGEVLGTSLKTACTELEKHGVAGSVTSFCLRGIALVFGIRRA